MSRLFIAETLKTPEEVIGKLKERASEFNFIVREIFDMIYEFRSHNVNVKGDMVFYSIMLCNPEKAYKSISKNPLRGALLLPPKQVIVYKQGKSGKTTIAYNAVKETDVKKTLPGDIKFQKSLPESCSNIIRLINEIK